MVSQFRQPNLSLQFAFSQSKLHQVKLCCINIYSVTENEPLTVEYVTNECLIEYALKKVRPGQVTYKKPWLIVFALVTKQPPELWGSVEAKLSEIVEYLLDSALGQGRSIPCVDPSQVIRGCHPKKVEFRLQLKTYLSGLLQSIWSYSFCPNLKKAN